MKWKILAAVLVSVLAALLLFACNTADPVGTPITELKFQPIADTLRAAGYDNIEISFTKPDGSDSTSLYKGVLSAGNPLQPFTLPDSLGKSYRIVVHAGITADPVASYFKVYSVIDGAIADKKVTIVPGTAPPDTSDPSKPPPAPTGVAIQPDSLLLADGGIDSLRLVAIVMPYPKAKQAVTWTSSNTAVASVDATGMVTSGMAGKAEITASAVADAGKSASIDVTVSKPLKADSVVVKDTLRVYTGMPAMAIPVRMVPSLVAPLLIWHSSKEEVATVSSDGKVTGVAAGQALVWAQYQGDPALADTCKVTVVYDPPVLTVGDDLNVEVGATVTFPIQVTQAFGGVVEFKWNLDGDAAWDSSSATIPGGLSHKYATAGDVTAKFSVKDLEGNTVTAQRLIHVGNNAPLMAIESPKEGSYVNVTPVTVAYKVNNVSLTRKVDLPHEGADTITIDTTINGVHGSVVAHVILDTKKPKVVITSPAPGAKVTTNPVAVAWTVDSVSQSALTSETLSAGDGDKAITRSFTDAAGNSGTQTLHVILDKDKPQNPVINAGGTSPSPTNAAGITWKWTSGGTGGNGNYRYWLDAPTMPVNPNPAGTPTAVVNGLPDGSHTLYVQEGDDQGNWSGTSSQAIVVDRTGPILKISQSAQTVTDPAFRILATATDPGAVASVSVSGAAGGNGAMLDTSGSYTRSMTLAVGANNLVVTATDKLGNTSTASVIITFDKPTITITYPPDGFVSSNGAFTLKYDYKVGGKVISKVIPEILADGANPITVTEPFADPKTIKVYILSTVIFVRGGAPAGGDGTSWDKAYRELSAALADSRSQNPGTKIWVSADQYGSTDVNGFFKPAAGVSLFGGFPAAGRPFTEAGRDIAGNPTVLANTADFGGLLEMAGSSTVDGFTLNQTMLGGEVVMVNGKNNVMRNCTFHSSQGVGDIVYANGDLTIDKCTFTNILTTGDIVRPFNASMTVTGSTITGNQCSGIATVDGTLTISKSTITNNIAFSAGSPKPDVVVQNGSLIDGKGNTSDIASLPSSP